MESGQLRGGRYRGICLSIVVSVAALALTALPAQAKAASPVLEYVAPVTAFPIGFTASGGEVTAALAGFSSVVHCSGSQGDGVITGPRSAVANYFFTDCVAQGGTHNDQECKSDDAANPKEITAEAVEADLVFISQAKHEVGMLLNPDEGVYMDFKCGGELVEAEGSFLSPVGPINKEATSFTASLSAVGALQTPDEYENALGEKRQAIPMGRRESNPPATTGVNLDFTIEPDVALQIKAITAAEIEAKQHEDEAAAAAAAKRRQAEEAAAAAAVKKRQAEEAAAAAAVEKRQAEEAAAAAAAKRRQKDEAQSERLRRVLLSGTIKQCRLTGSKQKRVRCEKRAKKRYGSARSS
jgi:hypothetical protein